MHSNPLTFRLPGSLPKHVRHKPAVKRRYNCHVGSAPNPVCCHKRCGDDSLVWCPGHEIDNQPEIQVLVVYAENEPVRCFRQDREKSDEPIMLGHIASPRHEAKGPNQRVAHRHQRLEQRKRLFEDQARRFKRILGIRQLSCICISKVCLWQNASHARGNAHFTNCHLRSHSFSP
jgi:hypothetical protein